MKKDEDFRIQEILDQKMRGVESENLKAIDTDDLEAYEVLYDNLKKKPGQGLPLSFKSNVLRQIEIEKKQAADTKFYWLLAIVFLVGTVVIASLSLIFKDVLAPSMGVIGQYKGFILIGIVAIVLFNIVEKRSNTKFKSVL